MRKKAIISLILLIGCLAIKAKTTYIPTYYSYIQIKQGKDTVSINGNSASLEMLSFDKRFTVSVHHEDVTHEKVKAIKRAKAAAGWSMFSAIMSTITPGMRGSLFSRVQDVRLTSMLTKMDTENAESEQVFEVEIWVENNSDKELIVNEMIRGLVWYVQPHQSIQFEVGNPELASLRVSDIDNNMIEFVTVGAGSSVRKEYISYEDDECWIADIYRKSINNDTPLVPVAYNWISKTTYEKKRISIQEFREFKKEVKKRQKQEEQEKK
jgi:hypothetical protein